MAEPVRQPRKFPTQEMSTNLFHACRHGGPGLVSSGTVTTMSDDVPVGTGMGPPYFYCLKEG